MHYCDACDQRCSAGPACTGLFMPGSVWCFRRGWPPHSVHPSAARLQLDLPKPLGLKFARGNDGGAYVIENNPKAGNTAPRIEVRGGSGRAACRPPVAFACGVRKYKPLSWLAKAWRA